MIIRSKHHRRITKKRKPLTSQAVLDRLNAYLNSAEPDVVRLLAGLWGDQQNAITYQDLRDIILNGSVDADTLLLWQKDYITFVNEKLKLKWLNAMQASASELIAKYPDYLFDPLSSGISNWIQSHGGELITHMTTEAREAINAMVEYAASGSINVDELSRVIRPTIGLTEGQSMANLKYYENMRNSLLKDNPTMKVSTAEKRARSAAIKYAERQHRRRAYDIAISELAFAYNKGNDEAVKQAIEQGLMGHVRRVWSTAADDGVCPICNGLNGVAIEMDEEFDFKGKTLYGGQKRTPPAHTRCRCAVMYVETSF